MGPGGVGPGGVSGRDLGVGLWEEMLKPLCWSQADPAVC